MRVIEQRGSVKQRDGLSPDSPPVQQVATGVGLPVRQNRPAWISAALDLFLGTCCAGCSTAGVKLCLKCELSARFAPVRVIRQISQIKFGIATSRYSGEHWLGQSTVIAANDYLAPLSRMILAFKEHQYFFLADHLGNLLGQALLLVLAENSSLGDPVVLVPVPTAPRSIKRRGFDHQQALIQVASVYLTSLGIGVLDGYWLVSEAKTVQKKLNRGNRWVAKYETVGIDWKKIEQDLLALLAIQPKQSAKLNIRVLLVDDVVTTGASLQESYRVLTRIVENLNRFCAVSADFKRLNFTLTGAGCIAQTPI